LPGENPTSEQEGFPDAYSAMAAGIKLFDKLAESFFWMGRVAERGISGPAVRRATSQRSSKTWAFWRHGRLLVETFEL